MKIHMHVAIEVPDELVPASLQPESPVPGELIPPYTAMDQLRGMLSWASKNWVVRGQIRRGVLPEMPWRTQRAKVHEIESRMAIKITEVL